MIDPSSTDDPPVDPTVDVVAHARFVRALAGALARDPFEADDLTSRALVAAIARGPDSAASLRTWLRRVVWRLFRRSQRDEQRRRGREIVAARSDVLPATIDLVAQMELQRQVGDAFARLGEPFKSALFRRYFHDETPTRIAQQLGVPLATVKSRLQRGLAQLRARLDAAHQGRREEWLAALVPLLPIGGPIVATKAKVVAVAAAAVLVAGASVSLLHPWRPGAADDAALPRARPAVVASAAMESNETGAARAATPTRAPVAGAAEVVSLAELGRWLHSSRRLDQVRAIELLVADASPEAARLLLATYLAASDRVLLALLHEAMVESALDAAPDVIAAFDAARDPGEMGKLAGLLAELATRRPELGEPVARLFVETLADPAIDPRGAGAAAEGLAQLDADEAVVRDAFRGGFESLRRTLDDATRSAADQDAARQKTGSLAWAASLRPAAEHDRLGRDLVDVFLRATDEPQAATLAWGLARLEGLTEVGRDEAVRSILASVGSAPDDALRQSYVQAVGQLVAAGYAKRPLDAGFDRLLAAAQDALDRNRADPAVAARCEWLLSTLHAFEQAKRDEASSRQ